MTGRGVRAGARLDRVHIYDVAPTIAHLLDLEMDELPGRVLSEALTDPP
jgi:hypothetical protein